MSFKKILFLSIRWLMSAFGLTIYLEEEKPESVDRLIRYMENFEECTEPYCEFFDTNPEIDFDSSQIPEFIPKINYKPLKIPTPQFDF